MIESFADFTDEEIQKILSGVQAEIKQRENKGLNDKANKEMLYIQENRRDLIDVENRKVLGSGNTIVKFTFEN